MKREPSLRDWFSQHTVAAALIFAVVYLLLDLFLNYFVSGDLQQGFEHYYQSAEGGEDLVRFVVIVGLFFCFGVFSKRIILELQQAREDESRRLNELKIFAHSIMHDVKNPAIGVHGMAALLKKQYGEVIDDRGKRYLEIMEQTSRDMVALMEQVNVFIRSRECCLTFEDVDVQTEVEIILESIRPTLKVRGIEWNQVPEVFPSIRGDRLSVHRIFRNLIDNALKYGGDGLSRIIVEYQESDGFHNFTISDNGHGIDESDQEGLFELFRRAKSSGRVEGLGLGLAIVKELVEKHCGTIQMNSGLEKGTTFIFSIAKNL